MIWSRRFGAVGAMNVARTVRDKSRGGRYECGPPTVPNCRCPCGQSLRQFGTGDLEPMIWSGQFGAVGAMNVARTVRDKSRGGRYECGPPTVPNCRCPCGQSLRQFGAVGVMNVARTVRDKSRGGRYECGPHID